MGDLAETLQALATCEERLDGLARELERLPAEIEDAESKAASARAVVADAREAITNLERKRRDLESDLQDWEARRDKLRSQTAMVKTNTEYHALLREIDEATERTSKLEEEILVTMDDTDQRTAQQSELEREQAEIERGHRERADALGAELQRARDEIAKREPERDSILERLSPEARSNYRRVRAAKGSGTTRIQGRSCAACHRDIPYETINRVLAGEWQTCPSCQRTLVGAPG